MAVDSTSGSQEDDAASTLSDFVPRTPDAPTAAPDPTSVATIAKIVTESLIAANRRNHVSSMATPKMGGRGEANAKESTVWTGGKPFADWSGTEMIAPKSVNQYRGSSFADRQKGHQLRSSPLPRKLKVGDSLEPFANELLRRLTNMGMDSISYVVDPEDHHEMINCITYHHRFEVDQMKELMDKQILKYDEYDVQNDSAASDCLMSSVSDKIAEELVSMRIKDKATNPPFPVLWLQVSKIVSTTTIGHFTELKDKLQNLDPKDYSGEDIAQMSLDITAMCDELSYANCYDHTLNVNILEGFAKAGNDDPTNNSIQEFRLEILDMKRSLHKVLGKVHFSSTALSFAEKDALLIKEGLTYQAICETAKDKYRSLFRDSKWPPARKNRDSHRSSIPISNNVVCQPTNSSNAPVANLLQQQKGTCHNCGKPGHYARECPERKSTPRQPHAGNGFQGGNGSYRRSNNGNNRRLKTTKDNSWKKVAPTSNEPQSKKVDGKLWHWCAKCGNGGRWSTTHGTNQHTGGPSVGANLLHMEHSAWCAAFNMQPTWMDLFRLFSQLVSMSAMLPFLGITLGFVLGLVAPHVSIILVHLADCLCAYKNTLWTTGVDCFSSLWTHKDMLWVTTANCLATLYTAIQNWEVYLVIGHWFLLLMATVSLGHASRQLTLAHQEVFSKMPRPRWMRRQGANFRRRRRRWMLRQIPPTPSKRRRSRFRRRQQKLEREKRPRSRYVLDTSLLQPLRSLAANLGSVNIPAHLQNSNESLRAALVAPAETDAILGSHRSKVIWDSGASVSISPCREDFVGPLVKPTVSMKLQGIAKGLKVEATGHVAWSFIGTDGMLRTLKVPALLVPKANVRLLSTTSLLQCYPDESITHRASVVSLSGQQGNENNGETPPRAPIDIKIDESINLPVGIAYSQESGSTISKTFSGLVSTVSHSNKNLSSAEKELLKWHFRLGHLAFKKIQFLMRTGVLAHAEGTRRLQATASKLDRVPMCTACQYGRQKRRSSPGKHTVKDRMNEGALKKNNLLPGQQTSVDHFVSKIRGRLVSSY